MSLWGNKDLVGNAGTIEIDLATKVVTGTATTFATVGYAVSEGTVLTIGAGATYGEATVTTVDSDTQLSIASTDKLILHPQDGGITGATYVLSEKPIYSVYNHTGFTSTTIYGVDYLEVGVAAGTTISSGGVEEKGGAYAVAHSGWVGVQTYRDMHGNYRVKSEVLVATGILTTGSLGLDRDDDALFPDS
jgi:hypothetical protein